MFIKTNGIVIRSNKTTSNDLFLTLYTKKAGKISVIAKNARSPKSSFSAASKIFTFGEYNLNYSGDYFKIVYSEVFDSHFGISENIMKFAYGMYILEILNIVTVENEPDPKLFNFIIEILDVIKNTKDDQLEKVRTLFLVKILNLTGIMPNLNSNCTLCSNDNNGIFSIKDGGLICKGCIEEDTIYYKINSLNIKLINYYNSASIDVVLRMEIDSRYNKKIISIYEAFLMHHFEIAKLNSKKFLDDMK